MEVLLSVYDNFSLITPDGTSEVCQIKECLGEGKFQVHRIIYKNNEYACKFFKPEDKFFFEQESHFFFLNHPNIAPPILSGLCKFDEGVPEFLVILTELFQKGTLLDFLFYRKSRMPEKAVRTFFHQIVQGIKNMHEHGTAHLDIKPENIFLTENYTIKIGDFDQSYNQTQKKLSFGTINYRPLEMQNKYDNFDPYLADIYGLGITLFVMHNGLHLPFYEKFGDYKRLFEYNEELYYMYFQKYRLRTEEDIWSWEFKELFRGLVERRPENRMTLEDIKNSSWYNQEICTQEEMVELFKS